MRNREDCDQTAGPLVGIQHGETFDKVLVSNPCTNPSPSYEIREYWREIRLRMDYGIFGKILQRLTVSLGKWVGLFDLELKTRTLRAV